MEEEPTLRKSGRAIRTFAMSIAHGTLPVAFITFYAGQKSQFNSKAFAGASNTTEKRWEHLNIRVDTVDRFQGAESPIVIASMVRSEPINEGAGQGN